MNKSKLDHQLRKNSIIPKKEAKLSFVILIVLIVTTIVILIDFIATLSFSWELFFMILFVSFLVIFEAKRLKKLGIQFDHETIDSIFIEDLNELQANSSRKDSKQLRKTILISNILDLQEISGTYSDDKPYRFLRFRMKEGTNNYLLLDPYNVFQIKVFIQFLHQQINKNQILESSK